MDKETCSQNEIYQPNAGLDFQLNIPTNFNDFLSDFPTGCTEEDTNNMEPNLSHKFYGYKKKDLANNYCVESFALPDDPIFSNSSQFLDEINKSLDTDTINPWDLSLINLNYVNCPWLVDCLLVPEHVITPYWYVDSLFQFDVDDVRQKVEPEFRDTSLDNLESDDFDWPLISETDNDQLFTSTPMKCSEQIGNKSNKFTDNSAVVKTIQISNKQDKNVDLSVLKDHVIKALEEVIKSKTTMTNIDMKIQIVTSLSENVETPTQRTCVEVRINDSSETTSSSKENCSLDQINCEDNTNNPESERDFTAPIRILNEECSTNVSSRTDVKGEIIHSLEGKRCRVHSRRRKKKRRFLVPTRRSIRSLKSSQGNASNLRESQSVPPIAKQENVSNGSETLDLTSSFINNGLENKQLVLCKNDSVPNNSLTNSGEKHNTNNGSKIAKSSRNHKGVTNGSLIEDLQNTSSGLKCDISQRDNEDVASSCGSAKLTESFSIEGTSPKPQALDELPSQKNNCNTLKKRKKKVFRQGTRSGLRHSQNVQELMPALPTEEAEGCLVSVSNGNTLKDAAETSELCELSADDTPTNILDTESDTNKADTSETIISTPTKRILRSSFKLINSDTVKLNLSENSRETFSSSLAVKTPNVNETRKHSVSESNQFQSKFDNPNKNEVPCYNKSEVLCNYNSSACKPSDLSISQTETVLPPNDLLKNGSNVDNISNDMCPTDHEDTENFYELPKLTREDDADMVELEEKKHLLMKRNGITNQVKIVLNPLAMKKKVYSTDVEEDLPCLSVELPLNEADTTEALVDSQPPDIIPALEEGDGKKKCLQKIEGKLIERAVYNLGDLVWAQVCRYPYWPAIICNDPLTNKYYDEVTSKNTSKSFYHLKFFGDRGRRAWVSKSHLLLYSNKDDLLSKKIKHGKLVNVIKTVRRKTNKWRRAVAEIESQKHNSYNDILENIDKNSTIQLLEERRAKRKATLDASSENEDELDEKFRKKKPKLSDVTNTSSVEEINLSVGTKNSDMHLNPFAQKLGDPANTSSKQTPSPKNDIIDKRSKSEGSRRRSGRSVKSVAKLDMSELNNKSRSTLILNPVALAEASRVIMAKDSVANTDEKSEEHLVKVTQDCVDKEQSDRASDVGSKASSDTTLSDTNSYSFEYQLELHKRNDLYQGLKKEKVCDYCRKHGIDLYKCKGKCNGRYHLACAQLVMEPLSKSQPKRTEKSSNKAKSRWSGSGSSTSRRSEEGCKTRSQTQCQIVTIKSKHVIDAPVKQNFPQDLSIAEQIDFGMKEMMSKFVNETSIYQDSTDSSSEEGSVVPSTREGMDSPGSFSATFSGISCNNEDVKSSGNSEICLSMEGSSSGFRHVTADSVTVIDCIQEPLLCAYCRAKKDPPCFACGLEVSKKGTSVRQKCSLYRCGRYYHPGCLKMWPQTQWPISGNWSKKQVPEDSFTCPSHRCHTCFSEELGSSVSCRLPGDKLARCLLCPAAFHATTFCTPAGCEILGGSQIVCPRHRSKPMQPMNTIWCFICSQGGNLVCCDTCPTSVHPECQPVLFTDDDKYICEDCESGRFPLYDEIVWVKLGHYRWWPAIILFPNEVPANVRLFKHQRGDFVVKFFGTNDYYWVNKSRSFLFQEGDTGDSPSEPSRMLKSKVNEKFPKAIEDAARAYQLKKEFKLRREAECIDSLKPPFYVRINKNKPVGKVKSLELNLSNATACECDPNTPFPCGSESSCINRLLMTECDPDVCPAGNRCRNQAFQKREYPLMVPYKTQGRGWGLKSLAPIKKGQFVIEYVGELIDSEEYQRRIKKMHEKKEENYYFMTVDGDRMIDAGPKGNLSRFMNHCCDPNCVTQKWTVKGDTRVGLFAKYNIDSGSELTFNYNLEVVGQEKKVCKCGAANCSGFIGVKPDKTEKVQSENVAVQVEPKKIRKYIKKVAPAAPLAPPCFICGKKKSDITCNNKFCNKGYHLRCLELTEMPEASKYTCPRHNCNTCSHRTIRCCVKCTNSFCPSHSDGNVRYDKFLGFVCRLHDPGISSTDEPVEDGKDILKERNPRHVRPPLLNGQKNLVLSNVDINKEVTMPRDPGENLKIPAQQNRLSRNRGRPNKPNGNVTKKIIKRRLTLMTNERKPTVSVWRLKKRNALRSKSRKTRQFSRQNNETAESRTVSRTKTDGVDEVSGSDMEINHYGRNLQVSVGVQGCAVSKAPIKREIDTFRTPPAKRQRTKVDSSMDESTVSSTTSDEGNVTRQSSKRELHRNRLETSEKDDQVSSSPSKPERADQDLDDVSLLDRLLKLSGKVPTKRMRYSVTRFSSTAKST